MNFLNSQVLETAIYVILFLGLCPLLYFLISAHGKNLIIFLIFYITIEPFILKFPQGVSFILVKYSLDVIILALFLSVVIHKLATRRPIYLGGIGVALLLFIVILFISGMWNQVPLIAALSNLRLVTRFFLVFIILLNLDLNENSLKRMISALLIAGLIQVAVAGVEFISPEKAQSFFQPDEMRLVMGGEVPIASVDNIGGSSRLFGTIGRYTTLGYFLSTLFCFSLAFYIHSPARKEARLYFTLSGLFFIIVLLTVARTALGTCLIASTLLPIFGKRKYLTLIIPVSVVLYLGASMIEHGPADMMKSESAKETTMFARTTTIFGQDYIEQARDMGRFFVLTEGIKEVLRVNPLLGLGPGSIGSTTTRFFDLPEAYNRLNIPEMAFAIWGDVGWATYLAQYGLLGLGSLLLIYCHFFRICLAGTRRSETWWRRAFNEGYLSYLLSMLFIWNFFANPLEARVFSFFFWVLSALMIIINCQLSSHPISRGGVVSESSCRPQILG